ncbi:septum formation inhibitor Maf [Gelidibacter salicanalis]|uniref:Septum formation inhibitor Maf n=1 Tax=Gelidibacter salicanalis TaxID=291193 RepID=A0A5C7AQW8_9FLAO|nr:septum formation inhibitor Maf [Gelidibacter salicanalis]TXE10807.1 septum formation inhibitor Maf [Gelidibacter salicanalis]
MKSVTQFLCIAFCSLLIVSCKDSASSSQITDVKVDTPKKSLKKAEPLSEDFKAYWYQGEAEITSYTLEQARYGEIRKGTAVLVYVTEPFLKSEQVKADQDASNNIPVLKLNATKNFTTGIYPYSIMQSVFYPVANNQHALKIACSVQEWCGQVYAQLNNRSDFEVRSHSYFEGEADETFNLNKNILENELWTQLRINPKSLPTGSLEIIPAFEFLRLRHIPFKAYNASAELSENRYTISYPELNRTISITYNPQSPFDIISWEETFISGQGDKAQELTTKATRISSIKSDYWNKNSNADSGLRESLGLE